MSTYTKLESDVTLPSRTKLTIDDVISLLRFALTNSFSDMQQYPFMNKSMAVIWEVPLVQ